MTQNTKRKNHQTIPKELCTIFLTSLPCIPHTCLAPSSISHEAFLSFFHATMRRVVKRQIGDWTPDDTITCVVEVVVVTAAAVPVVVGGGVDVRLLKPQSGRKRWTSEAWSRPESPGSLMYEADGDSGNHVASGPWFPFLYCTIALYTNGINPSINSFALSFLFLASKNDYSWLALWEREIQWWERGWRAMVLIEGERDVTWQSDWIPALQAKATVLLFLFFICLFGLHFAKPKPGRKTLWKLCLNCDHIFITFHQILVISLCAVLTIFF